MPDSQLHDRSKPDGLRLIKSGGRESGSLDRFLTALIATRERTTTALLAEIAELRECWPMCRPLVQ